MWLNLHFCQWNMFNRLTFNCFYLRSNVFLMGCCVYAHVWLLNNHSSSKLESSQFLILSEQMNTFKLQQLYPCKTKLDFKLELISLFTNYSRVIACCFVLLVSLSANQIFLILSLYTFIDLFFNSSGVSCSKHKGQLCDFISSLRRPITYIA